MAAPLQIGRYVLHGEIASGGMATVHYGRLVGTGGFAKTVAIKRLHRALAHNESFRKMILAEARLAARVRHPNVVPPLDVLAEGGELLLVMEYVHGESLSRLLRAAWKASERVPLAVGAAVLCNVLHGLHAAHEARDEAGVPLDIVHRDVSPQNIIVGADGVARVIDFGIAKAVTSEEVTTAGTIKGKVPYLAPEQLEGDPATRRTDLYAASVVFWEVLAGRRLFEGADDSEVLRNILTIEVRPPSTFNPLVPGTVDDVVLRGLARNPQDRFASAREMALALEEAIHLATSTVVGAWTERLAAETLASRAAAIAEVEASIPPSEERSGPATPPTQPVPAPRPSRPPPTPAPKRAPEPPASASPSSARTAHHGLAQQDANVAIPAPPAPDTARISLPGPAPARPSAPPARSSAPAPASSMRASSPPVRPPQASNPVIEPRTVIYEPPPQPEPAFVEGVRPVARGPSGLPPAPAPPPAGALHKPAIEIRNVDWLPPQQPQRTTPGSAFKRFLRYLAAFLALTLIVGYMFAPALARAWIVTGAAARGIVLSIDRVDVSRRAIRLTDVKAESPDLPGATMHAGTLVIGLHWLVPERITIDDAEIALDGPYGELSARYEGYRAKHPGVFAESLVGIRKIEVTSGRIDWKGVVGQGTAALVENITLDISKVGMRPLGGDYRLVAPLFTMQIAGKPAGPWQLDLDRQGILARAVLRFDPSGSYPAQVTRTAADDGSSSLSFQVPPTSLRDLHLPAAVLGGLASERTRLEAHGEVSIVAVQEQTTARVAPASDAGAAADAGAEPASTMTRSVSGHIVFAAGSLTVFPTGPLVDLSLDLPLNGEAARPIAVAGTLAVAPADPMGGASTAIATAVMNGTLDVSGPVARVDMTGKTGAIACVSGASPSGHVKGGAGAASANGLRASIVSALDDYPGAKVSFQPVSTCVPRLH